MKEIISQKEENELKRNVNSIILEIKKEDYNEFIEDKSKAKTTIDELIKTYKELFPSEIDNGYIFEGFTDKSKN